MKKLAFVAAAGAVAFAGWADTEVSSGWGFASSSFDHFVLDICFFSLIL